MNKWGNVAGGGNQRRNYCNSRDGTERWFNRLTHEQKSEERRHAICWKSAEDRTTAESINYTRCLCRQSPNLLARGDLSSSLPKLRTKIESELAQYQINKFDLAISEG